MTSFQYLMSTTIPPEKNRFSLDYLSQDWWDKVSTWMGDRLEILRGGDFAFSYAT